MRMRSSAFSISRHRVRFGPVEGAATAALPRLGGCGAAHQGQHAGGQRHITAGQAVALAAKRAAKLTSLTVSETMTMHGIPLPSGGGLIPGAGTGGGGPASPSFTMHAIASLRLQAAPLAAIAMKIDLTCTS